MLHYKDKYTNITQNGLRVVAVTHIGLKRTNNEDRYLITELDDSSLILVVADGMGGEVAGDYAAEILTGKFNELKTLNGNIKRELSKSILKADRAILNESKKNPRFKDMGTTVTCALLKDFTLYWAHVGDSRLYIFRKGKLLRLTKDQNMAQFLFDEGEISKEDARAHPGKYLLDQCVGNGDCEPETGNMQLIAGDTIILSTDGLHGEVDRELIIQIMKRQNSLESKADELLEAALHSGGKDNTTFILLQL